MTRLLLIRHAHVDTGPPPGRLCGRLDLPLSPTGWKQIRSLRDRSPSPSSGLVALYTSPLTRARATAAALGCLWQMDPRIEDSLAEIDCGDLEGMAIDRIKREHPLVWAQNLAQDDDEFAWPHGESYRQFRERVLTGLARLADTHSRERIGVVTHSGVIAQVVGALRGRPAAVWEHDRPEPLSATEVAWSNGRPCSILMFSERDWA